MRAIRAISWILTFVAIGAAAAAWFTPRPDVSAADAGDVAIRSLEAAGIDDASVRGTPTPGMHTPEPIEDDATPDEDSAGDTTDPGSDAETTDGDGAADATSTTAADETTAEEPAGPSEPVSVWIVAVAVGDDVIEMRVHETEGQLVYVDDLIGENRDQRLLTDEQWETVSTYRDDELDTWVERNIAGSVAAALIVAVGFVIARRTGAQTFNRASA